MTHFFVSSYFNKETLGRRGCDRMVVGFTTTCALSTFHHKQPINKETNTHLQIICVTVFLIFGMEKG